MRNIPFLLAILALGFGASGATADLAGLEAMIKDARERGIEWQSSRNDNARKAAKRSLEQAEKALSDAIKREPACQRCYELLAADHYYQAFFQLGGKLDDCVETATKGLALFPASDRLTLYKGYAHYQAFQFTDAARAFQRAAAAPDPAVAAEAKRWAEASQQQFLTNWNRQANFYQSPESRVMTLNPQSNQWEVRFQATPDWERQLGGLGFTALTANAPKLEDAEAQRYVEDIIGRLVSRNPGSPFDYRVSLLNTRDVNAVTPPGYVVVYRGLIEFAENEAELAGVLAHEMAHNYAHHAARAYVKGVSVQAVQAAVLQAIKPQGQVAQAIANFATQFSTTLFTKAYSRFEEKEADLYAAHIMFNAGYNPTAAANFHLKMYKSGAKAPVKFLSTHPPSADRATYYTDYLDAFPLDREMQMDSKAFQQVRSRLTGGVGGQPRTPGIPPPLR